VRTDDELREAIKDYFWWHSIELRPGIVTPGISGSSKKTIPLYAIPDDLSGRSVLDIGCWDGLFAFECERRGAERVVAADLWENVGRGAFDFAREELGSKVEPLECDVYDLPGKLGGERFDLVLFLGVLYHLRHPLLGLEKVGACTKPGGMVVIETTIDYESMQQQRPLMAFHPGNELNDDSTSWWSPNPVGLAMMLGAAGFAQMASVIQLWQGNRGIYHAVKASDEDVRKMEAEDYKARHRHPADKRCRAARQDLRCRDREGRHDRP
jgi:tRNA (mo5U34)-methyltransferase